MGWPLISFVCIRPIYIYISIYIQNMRISSLYCVLSAAVPVIALFSVQDDLLAFPQVMINLFVCHLERTRLMIGALVSNCFDGRICI